MKKLLVIFITYLILIPINMHAANKEHVIWDKIPISFVVPVGEERIISFPDRISVKNSDNRLTSDKVNILNNQGTLYIKAKKEFEPVRVFVTLQKSNDVILVDISSMPNVANTPLEVLLKDEIKDKSQNNNAIPKADYVSLIRAAIHELYAPERLIKDYNNLKRAPMYTEKSIPLFWNSSLMAMPLASWGIDNYYVTAVVLKNTSKRNMNINLDDIRGSWVAASLYPSDNLTKVGSKNDRTTLFLVSTRPFNYAFKANKGAV